VPADDLPDPEADQRALGALRTFFRRRFVADLDELDVLRPDVAIVGAPFDNAVTNRPGARFGPAALRSSAYEPGTYHLGLGIEVFDWLHVVDAGDAWCPHGQTERSHANIRERVRAVAECGAIPFVVGGDHSVTWPAATAVADVLGYGRVGMVHFDTHADTADIIEGNLASHGTPMRRLVESGAVRGRNFVQVGLRGYWPPADVFVWMQEQGLRWHLMDEVTERGIDAVIDDALAEAMDGCDALYVSVDIDVLDPAFAPGTGTPEPGGMTTVQLLRAVRRLVLAAPVVALDVMEVSPPYDWADLTVNAAHRVMFEALAALAQKKRLTTELTELTTED
jgi:agmatinase